LCYKKHNYILDHPKISYSTKICECTIIYLPLISEQHAIISSSP